MAWIGGTVGAGGAVAAGAQQSRNGKFKWFYILSFVVAIIVLLIVITRV